VHKRRHSASVCSGFRLSCHSRCSPYCLGVSGAPILLPVHSTELPTYADEPGAGPSGPSPPGCAHVSAFLFLCGMCCVRPCFLASLPGNRWHCPSCPLLVAFFAFAHCWSPFLPLPTAFDCSQVRFRTFPSSGRAMANLPVVGPESLMSKKARLRERLLSTIIGLLCE